MSSTQYMEELSKAFVKAIASSEDIICDTDPKDVNSRDAIIESTIKLPAGTLFTSTVDVQLKSVNYKSTTFKISGRNIKYALKSKNYNDLVGLRTTPIILILVVFKDDYQNCVEINKKSIKVSRSAFWVSLKGQLPTKNKNNVTIDIPISNKIKAGTLNKILSLGAARKI